MVSLGTYIFANFIFIYARHVVIKGRKQRHAKYDIVAYYDAGNLRLHTFFNIIIDQKPKSRYLGRVTMKNFLTLISIVILYYVATPFRFYNYSYRKNSL